MKPQSRRTFLASASLLTLGAAAKAVPMQKKSIVIHHVFFWLKNPKSVEDRDKLIQGVKTLEKIETVRSLHVGIPAETADRGVVDSSYQVTELMLFDDLAGQSAYQDHPIHKAFVEKYSSLWQKVVVYDSATV